MLKLILKKILYLLAELWSELCPSACPPHWGSWVYLRGGLSRMVTPFSLTGQHVLSPLVASQGLVRVDAGHLPSDLLCPSGHCWEVLGATLRSLSPQEFYPNGFFSQPQGRSPVSYCGSWIWKPNSSIRSSCDHTKFFMYSRPWLSACEMRTAVNSTCCERKWDNRNGGERLQSRKQWK